MTSPRMLLMSCQALHEDFPGELPRIAAILNRSLLEQDIERILRITSLDQLREKYGEQDADKQFFRKGVIGDWQNHFNAALLQDLEQLRQQVLRDPGPWQRVKQRLASLPWLARLRKNLAR